MKRLKSLFNKKTGVQVLRFLPIGVLNTAVDTGVLNLLIWIFQIFAGPWLIIMNFISFLIANINSFVWNKYWVFKKKKSNIILEYLGFFATSSVVLGIHSVVIYAITSIGPFFIGPWAWALFAKLVAVGIGLFWTFLSYKFIIFKK